MEENKEMSKVYTDANEFVNDIINNETWFEKITWPISCAYYKVVELSRDIKWFFRNVKYFRKELMEYRNWDYEFPRRMFAKSLEDLADGIKNGQEEIVSRDKKVKAINELVKQLRRDVEEETSDLPNDERHVAYVQARKERLNKIFSLIDGQKEEVLTVTQDEYLYTLEVNYSENDSVRDAFRSIVQTLEIDGNIDGDVKEVNTRCFMPFVRFGNQEDAEKFKKFLIETNEFSEHSIDVVPDTYTPFVAKFDGSGYEGWWT